MQKEAAEKPAKKEKKKENVSHKEHQVYMIEEIDTMGKENVKSKMVLKQNI